MGIYHPAYDIITGVNIVYRYSSGQSVANGAFSRASSAYTRNVSGLYVSVSNDVLRNQDFFWSQTDGVPRTLLERAGTNDVLWCRDLSNAAWTATNVTVGSTVGADGGATSASRLTATAGNGTVIVTTALVHASQARAASLTIKRITGTGAVQVTLDNGSTWTAVTFSGASYTWVPDAALQTLANSQFGIRIVTSGDVVDVDFCQNEAGTASTSPIATTTVSVTRSADIGPDFPFLPTAAQLAVTGVTLYDKLRITDPTILSAATFIGGLGASVTGNNCLSVFRNSGGVFVARLTSTTIDSSCTVTIAAAVGDTVERLVTVDPSTGAIQLTVSINGGAPTVGTKGTSGGWLAAFAAQRIYLSDELTAARIGGLSRSVVKVATGIQTLATMRTA